MPPSSLKPGAVLDGRFRIRDTIGRGGFGEVFRAEELLPNGAVIREVALKILSPESDISAWAEEAKLLASFSHPSLVTILAAGLVSLDPAASPAVQAPFVAMELLAGETLASVLARRGRIPWRRVLAWARDVAGALDVIHARGVIHLDLKPSNLFLTSAGVLKVLDFGIARQAGGQASPLGAMLDGADAAMGTAEFLAERGVPAGMPEMRGPSDPPGTEGRANASQPSASIVGTPGFIAPEIIEQRPATGAADAYALAACVVKLATGLLPQDVPDAPPDRAQGWWAEVRLATTAGRLRDLEASPSSLPKGVAALCRRLLALEPERRGVTPGGLKALFDEAWERPHGVPDPPYLGLVAFGPEAEGMLFGRDDDIARLHGELADHPVLVLQGISGSGKSSLAMAGLIPALARRDAASGPSWTSVVVRPGADPDAALEQALSSLAPELARADPEEIAAYVLGRDQAVAFVFDQLEELVTQASPERRERFVRFLAKASELPRAAPVRAIGTLREDFTSGLLALEPLGDRLRDALRFVGPPTAAAVREIVGKPARLAGARVEGLSEVADEVQAELRSEGGRLPLVALALSAWWRAREVDAAGAPLLTAARWAGLGGVRRIFADIADGVWTSLDPAAQAAARAALLELGRDGRTRQRVAWADLAALAKDPGDFDRAARAFIDAGLLVEKAGSIEIVHESLLTAWQRLSDWIAGAQASRRLSSALLEGARAWQDLSNPETRLPGDSEVALAELALAEGGLCGGDDADLVRRWLAAGRARTRRERIRTAALSVGAILVVAAGLGVWGLTVQDAQRRADDARRAANEASEKAIENERRAESAVAAALTAKEEADKSGAEREKAAKFVRLQQEQFDRMLREAESENERMRVRCALITTAQRARTGGCPPGDKLCAAGE